MEPSKLVISCAGSGLSSRELYRKLLDDYHLQPEMRAGGYVLLMTSVGDAEEGMERLVNALFSSTERQKSVKKPKMPFGKVRWSAREPEVSRGRNWYMLRARPRI